MKQERLNGFNGIAPSYDTLARLVFGKSIVEAQTYYLPLLGASKRILILGGGSGWIVEELSKHTTAEITYVEASSTMINLSRQRKISPIRIHYIHGTEDQIPMNEIFDTVITPFYLDMFTNEKLPDVLLKLHRSLDKNGLWLATDFAQPSAWWQRLLLKVMYYFFRKLCKIEAREFCTWEAALCAVGLEKKDTQFFYRKFIKSIVFVKR